jgi:protocatechuate 3,4-dioxygenase beta subunit
MVSIGASAFLSDLSQGWQLGKARTTPPQTGVGCSTMALTRRELMERCLSAGALLIISPLIAGAAGEPVVLTPDRTPTHDNDLGPFFKKGAPHATQLAGPGDPGLPLVVSGRVLDVRGAPLAGAVIDVWQADHSGVYDLEGYRYRSQIVAGPDGKYLFQTVMPGHYPGRQAQHIHYRVAAPGSRTLVTQLYFATDPVFEGDPERNYSRDPLVKSPELIRPVMLGESKGADVAAVTFEIVLAPA